MIIRINLDFLTWVNGFRIAAMAFYPFIIVNKNCDVSDETIHHERIHHAQQKELFIIGFFVLYLLDYLKYRIVHRFSHWAAYKCICFEAEANTYESVPNYLETRKRFAWKNHNKI